MATAGVHDLDDNTTKTRPLLASRVNHWQPS